MIRSVLLCLALPLAAAAADDPPPPVEITPRPLLMQALSGTVATGTVRVAFAAGQTGMVTAVQFANARMTAAIRAVEPARVYEIDVRVPWTPGFGAMVRDEMRVETDHPGAPGETLFTFATYKPPVLVQPSVLVFRINPRFPTNLMHRVILLKPGEAGPFTVRSVTWPGPRGEAGFARAPDGSWRLTFANILPAESLGGKSVRVETDLPAHPVVEIPIQVTVDRLPSSCPVCRQYGHDPAKHGAATNTPVRVPLPLRPEFQPGGVKPPLAPP